MSEFWAGAAWAAGMFVVFGVGYWMIASVVKQDTSLGTQFPRVPERRSVPTIVPWPRHGGGYQPSHQPEGELLPPPSWESAAEKPETVTLARVDKAELRQDRAYLRRGPGGWFMQNRLGGNFAPDELLDDCELYELPE